MQGILWVLKSIVLNKILPLLLKDVKTLSILDEPIVMYTIQVTRLCIVSENY